MSLLVLLLISKCFLVSVLYLKFLYQSNLPTQLQFEMLSGNNAVTSEHYRLTDKSLAASNKSGIRIFKILYWTRHNKGKGKWFGVGSDAFKTCKFTNCLVTDDKDELLTSDALLFHMKYVNSFPTVRLPDQKWIMHIRESPINKGNYSRYNGMFNTTWTYDRTSDIWTNSSHLKRVNGGLFLKREIPDMALMNRNYAQGRSKLVAWFVSHCQTKNKRFEYVKHLQNYIDVDIYGKCGSLKCERSLRESELVCLNMLKTTYKFYLSFENSEVLGGLVVSKFGI